MIGGLLAPPGIAVGSNPASCGLLAVMFVELFQAWSIVPNRWTGLLKLVAYLCAFIACGLLPYVDNFSNVGGFLFGLVSSVIFLPYITFGKWDYKRKRILLAICVPVLIVAFVICLVFFLNLTTSAFAAGYANTFDCYPFAKNMGCSYAINSLGTISENSASFNRTIQTPTAVINTTIMTSMTTTITTTMTIITTTTTSTTLDIDDVYAPD